MFLSDSCKVNNGGCGCTATCSHDSTTFAVRCTCKTGYTNTGTSSNVVCTGKRKKIKLCLKWSTYARLKQYIVDSCEVNNGGCGANTICSHDQSTFAVKCTCKPGFTNVGTGSVVTCKGNLVSYETSISGDMNAISFRKFLFQIPAR